MKTISTEDLVEKLKKGEKPDADEDAVVTGDARMRDGVAMTDVDRAVLNPPPGDYVTITSVAQFMELAHAAKATFDRFSMDIKQAMTVENAYAVRDSRVAKGRTWRGVAEDMYQRFGGIWTPPTNQLAGMALCEIAAAVLGENHREEPWN